MTKPDADGGLLDSIAEAACSRPAEVKPQEITNLLWAFATPKRRRKRKSRWGDIPAAPQTEEEEMAGLDLPETGMEAYPEFVSAKT